MWKYSVVCSEQLDAIALKKLVQFVHELMELYFSYVQQRVQLEVHCTCTYTYTHTWRRMFSQKSWNVCLVQFDVVIEPCS